MSEVVYFNGQLVPRAEARFASDDRGVLYGLGFFETFRTSGGRPHHWRYNRERLLAACATAGVGLPKEFLANDAARLREVVSAMLREAGAADAKTRTPRFYTPQAVRTVKDPVLPTDDDLDELPF